MKMRFTRFGGLSPVKQDQYTTGEDKTFHNPPRRRGIYAFPYPYIERFLLGATDQPGHISNKSQWLKDENGEIVKYYDFFKTDGKWNEKTDRYEVNPKYIKLLKKLNISLKDIGWCSVIGYDDKAYGDSSPEAKQKRKDSVLMFAIKKPRIFEYGGDIWHHLGRHLKPHQILATSGSWTLSDMDNYQTALRLEIHDTKGQMLKSWKSFNADINDVINRDPYKTMYAKDHLEVFIEQI